MGELAKTLNQLIDPQPAARTLPAMKPADPIPAKIGLGVTKGAAASAGGGIASPLTETAYADRTVYSDKFVSSSDGVFMIQCLKSVRFLDANNAEVVLEFKGPA